MLRHGIFVLLLCLLGTTPALAANLLVVSDDGADPGLVALLSDAGHTVTSIDDAATGSGTLSIAAFGGDLTAYDAIYWNANGTGSSGDDNYTVATSAGIATWVDTGGYLFVTDARANSDVRSLVGSTLLTPIGTAETATLADYDNSVLLTGAVDIRGDVRPSRGAASYLALNGLGADTRVVLGSVSAAEWLERSVRRGVVAYVGNVSPGGTATWEDETSSSALYGAAALNFAANAQAARLQNVLLVSDSGADLNIADALEADGHTVTVISDAFDPSGTTPALEGDLSAYDVVVWSASGSGNGSAHALSTVDSVRAFASAGGTVLVTGSDAVAAPTDSDLIDLLGCTGSRDTTAAPSSFTPRANFMTRGVVDVGGLTPTNTASDNDALTDCFALSNVVATSSNNTLDVQIGYRFLGVGYVGFISNGNGSGNAASWENTSGTGASWANAVLRNFVWNARLTAFDEDGQNQNDCDPFDSTVYPGAPELCDGLDNDCNSSTPDGGSEPTLNAACDGIDSDLCDEGVVVCTDGALVCNDTTDGNLDLCDGLDNDCDDTTPDGAHEPTLGAACDGDDDDACNGGEIVCVDAALACTDDEETIPELCDGIDNDCRPETADGIDEPTLGDSCDGDDTDLCEEGELICDAAAMACSDSTADNFEMCDGLDNDCNPATADGADEPTLGDSCDGDDSDLCDEGVIVCAAEAMVCDDISDDTLDLCDGLNNDCDDTTPDGSQEPLLGQACDGPDFDDCMEGEWVCVVTDFSCNDNSGDTIELCGGGDEDCDGDVDNDDPDIAAADPSIVGAGVWYEDTDADGCGDPSTRIQVCSDGAPDGYVDNDADADDTDGRCCGNGITTGSERCDDGDLDNGDGCDATCEVESGWSCDGALGVLSSCSNTCGDGTVDALEDCDDGDAEGGDGCDDHCAVEEGWICTTVAGAPSICTPSCGDGLTDGDERCDDGNIDAGDGCFDCVPEPGFACTVVDYISACGETCGDGIVDAGEVCDDGNVANADGCSDICDLEEGWTCPDPGAACVNTCGDGVIVGPEACDDGNAAPDDGCDDACAIEPHWICTGAPSLCSLQSYCGDGVIDAGEACDDGNEVSDDGCSDVCAFETGWICEEGEPTECIADTDEDGRPDAEDNCPEVVNPGQENNDGDEMGNACDDDDDNDGVLDVDDDCPLVRGTLANGCREGSDVGNDTADVADTGVDTATDVGLDASDDTDVVVSGGGRGGCASASTSTSRGALPIAALMMGLVALRRRR